ncbi:NAD(P)H-dependent oxidoreductase [Iningainema sp. BLCCT55]|uniref:NAD(P)H-dependent oxidoreductase n=2 Tax=Iningainema TaxID=1932705 RepID=A0A8J7BW83_9CYAN|nr:NAD(P)H-dependent oxidoreductase [Iningainema tapete BLCC-T55]
MMKILAISGSLRGSSSNTAICQAMVRLAPDNIKISLYEKLGELPHFNPELDSDNLPASVKDWRTQLKESNGVLICTPEYAHGVPGVLKNALDWIVSSGEFVDKPTAVISASPSPDGGEKAHASLVQTLTVMAAKIVEGATLLIPAISAKLNHQGEVTDEATAQALRLLLNTLAKAIKKH